MKNRRVFLFCVAGVFGFAHPRDAQAQPSQAAPVRNETGPRKRSHFPASGQSPDREQRAGETDEDLWHFGVRAKGSRPSE